MTDFLTISEIPNQIICYPRFARPERQRRLRELQDLGVDGILLKGKTKVGKSRVIGKGCVSLAVLAETQLGTAVLKIRRTDANRPNMFHEAEMLAYANSCSIGPKLWTFSENFLLIEFVDGTALTEWLGSIRTSELERLKLALRSLLTQCYIIDRIHLDHGELSNASKHVIVRRTDWSPEIIDFESASRGRHVRNLTSICQFLFLNRENSETLRPFNVLASAQDLKKMLRGYRLKPAIEEFLGVLSTCNLERQVGCSWKS